MNKSILLFFLPLLLLVGLFSFDSKKNQFNQHEAVFNDTIFPFYRATDHKGKTVVNSNGLLTLTTAFDNDIYLFDSSNRRGSFYVETKVGRFISDTAVRVPLNISIVIDRSGSMQGVKMGFAKKAAKSIIDRLTAEDMVSIVMYDTYVDSVQSPVLVTDREAIKKKIDRIVPTSATNLWGGAEMGYGFVKRNFKGGFINRVLLISDGLANVGLTDSIAIRNKVQEFKNTEGITISTFGVGLDYNETLMTDMAETGGGNYYFIDAPEKMSDILNRELTGLFTVAARNATLKILIPEGIIIDRSYPMPYIQNGNEITVKLRDLFSEETRATLFNFHIRDDLGQGLTFVTTLEFNDLRNGSSSVLNNENQLTPDKLQNIYLTHFNKPVAQQTILFTANENFERAMNLVDRGDLAGARTLLARIHGYMELYKNYVKGSDELKRMDSIFNNYTVQVSGPEGINTDSLKKIQKTNKAANYFLRQKKKQQ
jgi:Ca-activated chloride channel family protein